MRNFVLGLLVGGIAVYLWRESAARAHGGSPQQSRAGAPELAKAVPPESEARRGELEPAGDPDAAQSRQTAGGAPSYQTAPLAEYSPEHQGLAEHLFAKAVSLAGHHGSEKYKGSYSFLSEVGSTAAKIIIYERRHGKENGAFPMLQDGVYVLLRTQRHAPNTLGVAPRHEERFHYRRVNAAELDAAAQEIADVLRVGDAAPR